MSREALAFVARREGASSMPASRWAHVMSLELGWMRPAEAKAYVAACADAGLLAEEGEALALTFDEDDVEIPRRFRPDATDLPKPARPVDQDAPAGFEAYAKRLAKHQERELSEVLDDVAVMQERMGGLLHAEAAVLRLMAEAGLDVRKEAQQELERLTGAKGSAG